MDDKDHELLCFLCTHQIQVHSESQFVMHISIADNAFKGNIIYITPDASRTDRRCFSLH